MGDSARCTIVTIERPSPDRLSAGPYMYLRCRALGIAASGVFLVYRDDRIQAYSTRNRPAWVSADVLANHSMSPKGQASFLRRTRVATDVPGTFLPGVGVARGGRGWGGSVITWAFRICQRSNTEVQASPLVESVRTWQDCWVWVDHTRRYHVLPQSRSRARWP
jgi:hypothetical protein